MTQSQKRTYRTMAFMFIGIASAFGLVALSELILRFEFFSGNVVPMALFLGVIGALLLQTVRQSDTVEPDEAQLNVEHEPDSYAEPDFTTDAYKPDPYGPNAFKPDLERSKDSSKD